jgi:hypothetical protein
MPHGSLSGGPFRHSLRFMQFGQWYGKALPLIGFSRNTKLKWQFVLWSLGLVLVTGCASRENFEMRERGLTAVKTPHPPEFFTGLACALMTNGGFSARVAVQVESVAEQEANLTGQMLGLGSKLLFAPDPGAITDKHQPNGGFSFIWDAKESRGYVLSEALQAYAPVSSKTHITNVVISATPAGAQKFAGHPCERVYALVQTQDGTGATFELLRATDLKGFPLKITSITNSTPLTVTFSKIHLESPGAEVFTLPDSFTKYTSVEAMADELAARNRNLRRKPTEEPLPLSGYPSGR